MKMDKKDAPERKAWDSSGIAFYGYTPLAKPEVSVEIDLSELRDKK